MNIDKILNGFKVFDSHKYSLNLNSFEQIFWGKHSDFIKDGNFISHSYRVHDFASNQPYKAEGIVIIYDVTKEMGKKLCNNFLKSDGSKRLIKKVN
jgi:hypothetical protein